MFVFGFVLCFNGDRVFNRKSGPLSMTGLLSLRKRQMGEEGKRQAATRVPTGDREHGPILLQFSA